MLFSAFHPSRLQKTIVAGISALLFCFVASRAFLLGITPDEVFSLQLWVTSFTVYPETYTDLAANHHWLNSWGMWLFSGIFGDGDFVLRLPNVLAYLVYLWFTYRLSALLAPPKYLVVAFLLLNVHPYMLDFFSLARGYGLALAGIMAAVFYLLRFVKTGKIRLAYYSSFAISLALLSNFNTLPLFLIITALLIAAFVPFSGIVPKVSFRFRDPLFIFLGGALLLSVILPHIFAMKNAQALYYGSPELWEGTVNTLATSIAYDAPYAGDNHFVSLKPVIHFMNAVIIAGIFLRFRQKEVPPGDHFRNQLPVLLLPAMLIVLVLQHYLLGVLYPINRTALPVFILYLLAFSRSLLFICNSFRYLKYVPYFVALPFMVHFALMANRSHTLEWRPAGQLSRFIDHIARENKQGIAAGQQITISTNGVSGVVLEHLSKKPGVSWLKINTHWDTTAFPVADYYILEKGNYRYLKNKNLVPLDTNRNTGNILFRQGNGAY